jgi:hypothetical protein
VLCLLEAARLMPPTLTPARGELAGEDLDYIRAAMLAASLSVRSYLWRTRDNVPVDRKRDDRGATGSGGSAVPRGATPTRTTQCRRS